MATGYASYYKHQTGGSPISIYSGRVSQRGHGVGGFLSSLLRGATPVFKSLGKSLLNAGLNVAGDVLSGEGLKRSLKKQGKTVGRTMLRKGVKAIKGTFEPPKKKIRRTVTKIPKKKKKRTKKDLFSLI